MTKIEKQYEERVKNSTLKISQEVYTECFNSGFVMADSKDFQCPAYCKITMNHIAALSGKDENTVTEVSQLSKDGDYRSIQILNAWRDGYRARNDEICNAILLAD